MKNRGDNFNVLRLVFYELFDDVSHLHVLNLKYHRFLTVIQFYRNIDRNRVGKSPEEILTRPIFRNILINLKETR